MELSTKIRVRGHLWDEIREDSKGMKKAGFIIIARPPSYSELRRTGSCVTAISVKPKELPKRVQDIAYKLT